MLSVRSSPFLATELWRDPAWQAVGAGIALLALAASVWLFFAGRPQRRLVYRATFTAVVGISEKADKNVAVSYRGEAVRSLTAVAVTVRNAGNEAIPTADYERPISFGFPGGRILSATVSRSEPVGVAPDLGWDTDRIQVYPLLLNSGDEFTLDLLVADGADSITPDVRVAGVHELAPERMGNANKRSPEQAATHALWVALACGLVFYGFASDEPAALWIGTGSLVAAYLTDAARWVSQWLSR